MSRKSLILLLAFVLLSSNLSAALAKKAEGPREAYFKARKALVRFSKTKEVKRRDAWLKIIDKFRQVYLRYPESGYAPAALLMMGRCYEELYGYSGRRSDLLSALRRYQVLVERYPRSRYADDALLYQAKIYVNKLKRPDKARKVLKLLLKKYPKRDKAKEARKMLARLKKGSRAANVKKIRQTPKGSKAKSSSNVANKSQKREKNIIALPVGEVATLEATKLPYQPVLLKGIRHWSSENYTRVVLDLADKVTFSAHLLRPDPKLAKPMRLYIDLRPALASAYLKDEIPIKNGLLKAVRVGQYRPRTVRVVLDLGSLSRYKVFYLEEPFRVVVDIIGRPSRSVISKDQAPERRPPAELGSSKKGLSLAQQLGLTVRRIVIDPGHGGKDPGAIGPTGLKEKSVTLRVARLLRDKLRKKLGCEVIITRNRDVFLPLEQRTAIANTRGADLFVSIHTNASPRRRAYGVETYYLNFTTDEEAMRVAARENAVSQKSIGQLRSILKEIMLTAKVQESSRLAECIQQDLVGHLRRKYSRIKDHGVKQAPFFVLIGAQMPAVLVEISFISNPREERRLKSAKYLDSVAEGIARGIIRYIKETQMAYLQ
ncbi:N-acetylmuramoyl-L-alanine amidase [Thermosulfuriphilus sp.]